MNKLSDNLIKEAKQGNTLATEELITKYKPLVNSIARQYFLIGGETEDLIQEGMLGLFNAIQSYEKEGKASFKTFATLLIKRRVQDAIKHANRQKNQALNSYITVNNQGIIVTDYKENEEDEELGIYIKSNLPTPENLIISKENQSFIKTEIEKKLTILEKNILQLFIEGKSYGQIAETLNLTKKTVDNNLFRIRKKLSYLKQN